MKPWEFKNGNGHGKGAPKGNSNAKKGSEWRNALRHALETYSSDDVKKGTALARIAKKVVESALEGDKDAWTELGNRLDGKVPVQLDLGDENAIPLQAVVTFVGNRGA